MNLIAILSFIIINVTLADNFICDDNSKSCDTGNKRTSYHLICGDKNHPCNEQERDNNESEEQ